MRAPLVIYFSNALSQRSKTAPSCSNLLNRDIAQMLTQHPGCERILEGKYMVCRSGVYHRFAITPTRFARIERALHAAELVARPIRSAGGTGTRPKSNQCLDRAATARNRGANFVSAEHGRREALGQVVRLDVRATMPTRSYAGPAVPRVWDWAATTPSNYLSASLTASMPAWAQLSSSSAVPPLTPIAPMCTLSAVMIGNPPAKAMMPGTSASPGTIPPLRSLP